MKWLKYIIIGFILYVLYLYFFNNQLLIKLNKQIFNQALLNNDSNNARKPSIASSHNSSSQSLLNTNVKNVESKKKFSAILSVNSLLAHNNGIRKISSQSSTNNATLYNESDNSAQLYAVYVSEYDSNQVSICKPEDNFHYICRPFLTGLVGPANILINNNILYVLNGENSTLTYCAINNNILGICNSISSPVNNPSYLIITTNNQLLISDNSVKNLALCNIDGVTGNISTCNKVNTINSYTAFYFKKINYAGLVYYPNYTNSSIDICDNINESANCVDFEDKFIIKPFNLVILNKFAYIVNTGSSVTRCSINQNGILNSCIIINSNFNSPVGVAVNYLH